ncbi:MAG TPA: VCBS repeat-containing protein, partial [Candidatus Limnocylindrales bacterium]|nr:VCBS repeat-containing protein [Candidatus Limnocylindrales bacterium]
MNPKDELRQRSITCSHVGKARLPLSPRRRRLYRTIGILVGVSLLALLVGSIAYYRNRPKEYRPDEKMADITSSLARNLPKEAPKPVFTDVTRDARLASFRTFLGARTSQLPEDMGAGIAWGDFNNDGYDDVFLVSAGGPLNASAEKLALSELYENLGDGTFQKVDGFPELRIHGMAAAWADYDGDGYLDLIVTGYNTLLLFHNEGGTGKFVRD